MARQCRAQVDGRPCNSSTNVLENGFCHQHQAYAIVHLNRELDILKENLRRVTGTNRAELLQRVEKIQRELKGVRHMCAENPQCMSDLQHVLTEFRSITSQYQIPASDRSHPIARIKDSEERAYNLTKATSGIDAEAMDIRRDEMTAHHVNSTNSEEMNRLRARLIEDRAAFAKREGELNDMIVQLRFKAEKLGKGKHDADAEIQRLQNALTQCKNAALQVTGENTTKMADFRKKADEYKRRYETLKGREMLTSKKVDELMHAHLSNEAAIKKLTESYETKIKLLKNDYAKLQAGGEDALSAREQELEGRVGELEKALASSLKQMEALEAAGTAALDQLHESKQEGGVQLSREYLRVTNQLKSREEELSRLRVEQSELREAYGKAQMNGAMMCEKQAEQAMQDLKSQHSEIAQLNQTLSKKQQEIMHLTNQKNDMVKKSRSEVTMLQTQLRNYKTQLSQAQAERRRSHEQLQLAVNNVQRNAESQSQSHKLKYQGLMEKLRTEHQERQMQLANQFNASKGQLEARQAQLQQLSAQIKTARDSMAMQQREMDTLRVKYESQAAEMAHEKAQMAMQLERARQVSERYNSEEVQFKKRLAVANQMLNAERTSNQKRVSEMTQRLQIVTRAKDDAESKLRECAMNRSGAVARVQQLSTENASLKNQLLQLTSKMNNLKSEYSSSMARMQGEALRGESNLAAAKKNLEDASLVHDHVKRLQEEGQRLRAEAQKNAVAAKQGEAAMRRLVQEKSVREHELARMRAAMEQSQKQQQVMQSHVTSTNQSLREASMMNVGLQNEMQRAQTSYEREMNRTASRMREERINAKAREIEIRRRLDEAEKERRRSMESAAKANVRRIVTEEALVDSELQSAKRTEDLLGAAKFANVLSNDGRSKF